MISLKEHIEKAGVGPASSAVAPEQPALAGYRDAIAAFGAAGEAAMPPVSREFHQSLAALAAKLTSGASPETIGSVRAGVAAEIGQWSESASRYFKEKSDVVREIIMVVARTAEAVGERDSRYASQFGGLTGRLREIALLENFASVRKNLVESAALLTACVAKMTEEGHQTMDRMRAEVEVYRSRLQDAERRASVDPLTGLANRRATEESLAERIRQNRPFSVILLDLNNFKEVNDSFGHPAGDDLLHQFATELRAQFAPSDMVGRWGGDEFIGILEGRIDQALKYHDRIKRCAFGAYSVPVGTQVHKIQLHAAVGIAEWNGCESARDLIARADRELYDVKVPRPPSVL
jgi:diguanylate cyclase (GGDEF)-like protein